jgi:Tol biopolymer transport system component
VIRRSAIVLGAVAAAAATAASGEQRIADLLQGTNFAVAAAPDGTALVIDLVGQLWRLPVNGGGAEPLTPAGEVAREPRFSPDGKNVVYQRLVGDQWDLALLNIGERSTKALTDTPYSEREPDFTPDGRSIVFAADRTGHYCLWSLELENGVETQLTEEPGQASFPAVADNGAVAYVLDNATQSRLRMMTNGVAETVYEGSGPLSAPGWRPGGDVLVFSEDDRTVSSRLRMLVLSEPKVVKPLTGAEDVFKSRPAWLSPAEFIYAADGRLWRRGIAAVTRQAVPMFAATSVESFEPPMDLGPLDPAEPQQVYGVNGFARSADGKRAAFTALGDLWLIERGKAQRLTNDSHVDIDPAFAADGESVLFASDRTGGLELWRLSLRDQRATQLTFGSMRAHAPAPSPDGRRIAYLESDGLGPWAPARLMVMPAAGTRDAQTLATGLEAAEAVEWSPDGRTVRVRAAAANIPRAPGASPINVETVSTHGPPAAADAEANGAGDAATLGELRWSRAAPAPEAFVLQVGRLFDGVRGEYRRHVDIHVAGGRITAIVGRGVRPYSAPVISAVDATVIPGLVDLHVHQSKLAGERLGRAWLSSGVTTVREIATDPAEAIERGEAWASGRMLGPRLVITPAKGSRSLRSSSAVPVHAYPGIADGFAHSLPRQPLSIGSPLAAASSIAGWPQADGGGEYELAVSTHYTSYQDSINRMVASSTVLTPALAALRGLRDWPKGAAPHAARDAVSYRPLIEPVERRGAIAPDEAVAALERTVAKLIRDGGKAAVGSDAPTVPYGLGVHFELAMLAEAGVANDRILRLATAEGALALGLERQIGTLEEGKLADFVVIDGDPLVRIADAAKVTAVVKGGVWLDRKKLMEP